MSLSCHGRVAWAVRPTIPLSRPLRVAVLAAIAALVGALQLAAPQPAAAITGLKLVSADSVENRDEPLKFATAHCPPRKVVVGGGGEVLHGQRTQVALKELRPFTADPPRDASSFLVTADSVNRTRPYDWTLRAYAICADRSSLSRYFIARGSGDQNPAAFKASAAVCPSGTVAYGSGANAGSSGGGGANGKVWLQLVRTSGPLDISRATARTLPGFNGPWSLGAWAICAAPQGGIHADGTIAQGADASDRCSSGFRTLGIGGGGGPGLDGGPVWLDKIAPHPDLRGVDASITGLFPDGQMLAHQTCAQATLAP